MAWHLDQTVATPNGELAVYRSTTGNEPPLVIKQCPEWTADHVRGLSLTLEVCRRHGQETGIAPFVAAPRGWGGDPVFLCTEWVEGTDMRTWYADTFASLPVAEAVAQSQRVSGQLAGLVAHYHQAMADADPAERGLPLKATTMEESGMAVRLIRVLRGSRGLARAERVRSIDDPGAHNTVVTADGALWLIDLPAHLQMVTLERDIARLASRMVGAVQKHSNSLWLPRMGHYRGIVDAVVEGYEAVGSPEGRPVDVSLVYACLTADAVLKVARTRGRRVPGTRLEAFVRESLAAIALAGRTLRLRVAPGRRRG